MCPSCFGGKLSRPGRVFSLSCRRKHRALDAGPLDELESSAVAEVEQLAPRQATVDALLAWASVHPGEGELRARAEEEHKRAQALEEELSRLRAEHQQLAHSVTVRAAERIKRLPLAYPAYLAAKSLLRGQLKT